MGQGLGAAVGPQPLAPRGLTHHQPPSDGREVQGPPPWVQASGLVTSPSICVQQQRCLAGSWTGPGSIPRLRGVGDLAGPCLSSSSVAESGLGASPRLRAFFSRALHSICCQTHPKVSMSHAGHRLPRNALPACQRREAGVPSPPPSLGAKRAPALMSSPAWGIRASTRAL